MVDASSKIAMMSDDEVLVVVDKEPVAIENSFFKNTTQNALQMAKCNQIQPGISESCNEACPAYGELDQQKSCYHKCIVYK